MTAISVRRLQFPFWPTVLARAVAWVIAWVGLLGGAVLLVATNVALQRLVRPDRGTDPIAGCCGMALPNDITAPQEDAP